MTNTLKGEQYVSKVQNMFVHQMIVDIEDYSSNYNWCMHKNLIAPDKDVRIAFYNDLDKMPFDILADKHLSRIKEEIKKKKQNVK